MKQKRLLQLAGIKPLHEAWGEGFEQPGADSDDMDGSAMGQGQAGGQEIRLRSAVQKAARDARRDGTSKEEFDHMVLALVDDIWSQMQTVRKRGERVGSTPRF